MNILKCKKLIKTSTSQFSGYLWSWNHRFIVSGWWFQPSWKIWVMENKTCSKPPIRSNPIPKKCFPPPKFWSQICVNSPFNHGFLWGFFNIGLMGLLNCHIHQIQRIQVARDLVPFVAFSFARRKCLFWREKDQQMPLKMAGNTRWTMVNGDD